MATTEELERALQWAKDNDNQEAIDAVSDEMTRMTGARPRDRSLPEHMDQDRLESNGSQGALPDEGVPSREAPGALPQVRKPSQDQPWSMAEYEKAGALQNERERGSVQEMYDADQAYALTPESRPTNDQINEFFRHSKNVQYGAGVTNSMRQQVMVDQDTGKVRWSALSPDQMDEIDQQGSTSAGVLGAFAYSSTRIAGPALQNQEAATAATNSFQNWLVTEGLPPAERDRIMNKARQKWGNDHRYVTDPGTMPASQMKAWMDENPDNEKALEDIVGNEWWEGRKEFMARGLSKIGGALTFGLPSPGFGADDPSGPMTGGAEFYENVESTARFPGVSEMLNEWERGAATEGEGGGIWEHLVSPYLTNEVFEGVSPGERAEKASVDLRNKFYDAEQEAEAAMPLLTPDIEINSIGDLWDSFTSDDPNTKLANPESLLLMALENTAELAFSYFFTRGAGSLAARRSALANQGQTLEKMNKARELAAGRAGMAAGSAAEGLIVATHLETETRSVLDEIPMEIYRQNALFQKLMEGDLTEEDAKQIMMNDAAGKAATTAAVITMMTGGYMNRFVGKSGAGRLVQSNAAARRTTGAILEPATEGMQEIFEMMQTEAAVRPIDPDNAIYKDPNRYWEAGLSGAIVSLPFGAAAALEPSTPAGISKEDVAVSRAAAKYMDATNARFKYQAEISSPEHIANTTPNQRLRELQKMESLQFTETETFLKAEPMMRAHMEKQGTLAAKAELKMLGALKMRANAMETDIAVARSRRQSATQMRDEEQSVLEDRSELQRKVSENIVKLDDLESQSAAIEAVQNLEAVTAEQEMALVKDGYAKRTTDGKLIIKPKGRRAIKELNRQSSALRGKLESGYVGAERRAGENLVKRDLIDSAGPASREEILYQDNLTGAQNRRAFNERQENIDVREGETAVEVEGAQAATAAVDVDSLAWVNDNMAHSAGDRLLVAVSDALGKQEGVEVYRLGGDEFAVTGASEEALETALQAAAAELLETEIASGNDAVTPQITWGKGENYEAADNQSIEMKQERQARGVVAGRKKQAATYRNKQQKGLFQLASIPNDKFNLWLDDAIDDLTVSQAFIRDTPVSPKELKVKLNKGHLDESYAAIDKSGLKNKDRARMIAAMRLAGDSNTKIASNLKISVDTVESIISRAGLPNIRKIRAQEKRNQVIQLLAEGKTRGEVASEMGTSRDVVRKHVKLAKADGIVVQETKAIIPLVKRKEIKRLLQLGETQREIAKQVGISRDTVKVISKAVKKGLFQMDKELSEFGADYPTDMIELYRSWNTARFVAERGDHIEILTPDGAVNGVITKITNRRNKPRIIVNVQGRSFRFNPGMNWLIIDPLTNPADLAWITGDAEYAQPGRETFPQTIKDVQIGHMSKDGIYYADLAQDYVPDTPAPWWYDTYPDMGWHPTVPYVMKMPEATQEEFDLAEAVKVELTSQYSNVPKIHMVKDMAKLKLDAPEIVKQMVAEGGSLSGVRGYMDHVGDTGIYIFVPNIGNIRGKENLAQGVAETIMHEMIGHWGVRGFFGDELDLRIQMHNIVDSFPRLADHYARKLGLNKARATDKQLLGEEMVAYMAGEVLSGGIDMTPRQKNAWQKFLTWVREFLHKRGWNRWSPVKKFDGKLEAKANNLHDTKVDFWNDERIQELIHRSKDFVNEGGPFEFRKIDENSLLYMRDRDIFQAGVVSAITSATVKLSNNERRQRAQQQKVDVSEIPREAPLFADKASPNVYKQAVIKAQKDGHMTKREMELSGLDESSDFFLFRDASYGTIMRYIEQMNNGNIPNDWYKGVVPANVEKELDDINAAMRKNYIVGPTRNVSDNRDINTFSADLMRTRIKEILTEKIDPKKTQLSKEILLAHMASENVFRVYVETSVGHPKIEFTTAADMVLGEGNWKIDDLTDAQEQMIKDEIKASLERGPDIGYDAEQDRWLDWARHTTEYSEWSPQGSRSNSDFRVALIKSEGKGGDMGYSGHYDKNLMHLRTGVAELLDTEGMGLEFPNPEMKGKLLSLIELQSDWLQKLRKGFSSGDAQSEAETSVRNDRALLNMAGDQFGQGIREDLYKVVTDVLRPIMNVPDGSGDSIPSGSALNELSTRAQLVHGQTWEEITKDQKREIWQAYIVAELDKVSQPFLTARDELQALKDSIPTIRREGMGTLDARKNERLDNMSMRRVTEVLRYEMDRLFDHIHNKLRYAEGQEQLVESVREIINSRSSALTHLASNSDYSEMLRLPMITYQLQPMLEKMYATVGADVTRPAALMSGLQVREMATVRVPVATIKDLNTAMADRFTPVGLMQEIILPSRIDKHSDIAPGTLSMKAVMAGDDFIDVKVIGSKADIQKVEKLIPELVESWVKSYAQKKLDINNEKNKSTADDRGLKDGSDLSWDEIENEYGMEESDVDGEGDSAMSEEGVTSYYDFEQEERGEIESEIVQDRINEMSDDDWDNLEGDFEGISRGGDSYREALIIDEDGDVDNSDAESNLETARDDFRMSLYEDEAINEQTYIQTRDMWDEKGATALIVGSLPNRWDSDNEPTDYVQLMIRAQSPGDVYEIYIDGSEIDYETDLDDAKSAVASAIYQYYDGENIVPPVGVMFGPDKVETPENLELEAQDAEPKEPNWEIVGSNISTNMQMMSDASQKMDKVFERFVTNNKKLDGGVNLASLLAKDENWRPLALKYLIADAVRRGLGGVMWNNGLSSATRGGMGMSDTTSVDRITWTKETVTLRGKETEIYVVRHPDSVKPIAIAKNKLIPILGRDVMHAIAQQEAGTLASPEIKGAGAGDADPRDNYLIAVTEQGTQSVYRRADNYFLGFAQNDNEVRDIINLDIEKKNRIVDAGGDPEVAESQPLGRVTASGTITSEMMGGKIHIIKGSQISGYRHDFVGPKLAGARESYEDITVRIWNKELKKYGVQIDDTFVKAQDMKKALEEEGQTSRVTAARDEKIAEEHGSLYIAETSGPMHHFIVMSEKQGPVINDVWKERSHAEDRLNEYIRENYGEGSEGVKVMYFPINDKMREEFSGPVAPFHYDPTEDPALKEAAEKVGYKPTPLGERFKAWREAAGAEFIQGSLDRFYGLRRALNATEVGDSSYISARLTTSLDSMMKGILYHGSPVWVDGAVRSEGKGLADILQPIMADPDTWGLYMYGVRAKRLMLEGLGDLTTGERSLIDKAAAHFDNDIMNMMAFAWSYDPKKDRDPGMYEATKITNAEKAEIHSAESTIDDLEDVRDNDVYRDREGRLIPKEWAEKTINELRDKLIAVKTREKPPSQQWIDQVNAHLKFYEQQLNPQEAIDELKERIEEIKALHAAKPKTPKRWAKRDDSLAAMPVIEKIMAGGRENLWKPDHIRSMIALGDKFPQFKRVAKEYAAFNKKVLDFAESSGLIDKASRPVWENADYVPFHRVEDERLVGSSLSPHAGIANQRSPIVRLRGGQDNIGDIMTNIMMNVTKLVDASVKNNAAMEAVDALRGSGMIAKQPMKMTQELVPMGQVKKILIDRGMDPKMIPDDALIGLQKMMAVNPPEGPGVIAIMRDGKREYYKTDDMLLWRALTAINKKAFGRWIKLFSAPKSLVTRWITIDPAFMIANLLRDTGSAFVISRDTNVPIAGAIKGMGQALFNDKTMRILVSAGAAFENGYITGGDPDRTRKILRTAMRSPTFVRTVLDSPLKLMRAWRHLGSSMENANRVAVYNAAIAAGKSQKQALYEAKDLMDFTMGGDWPVVQFLVQTVPFMNARAQGNYRLARGAKENPIAFTVKGMMIGMAGLALYLAFKDDERYEELETWDKHAYFHWWVGEAHYRLPKPFEVGAIFNTIPEMLFEKMYSEEDDSGKELMKGFGHMLTETFAMNPLPQTVKPMFEMGFNYNFFTKRPIVSYYEQQRLPPDQYRYRTSPTMIELSRLMPSGLDSISGKLRSPLHLQNMYSAYTGTLGRYMLQGADAMVRGSLDYPLPPSMEARDVPVYGRFVRGSGPARNTKQQTEMYNLLDKVVAIQGSLRFHEKQGNVDHYLETHDEYLPYIRVAKPLEAIREDVQDMNRAIMQITLSTEIDPDDKASEIDILEKARNNLFNEAYKLRPGGEYNPLEGGEDVTKLDVIDLIDNFGIDNSTAFLRHLEENAPSTFELLTMVQDNMELRSLSSLAKIGAD